MLVKLKENSTIFPFHAFINRNLRSQTGSKKGETAFQVKKYAQHMFVSSTDSRLGMLISAVHIKKKKHLLYQTLAVANFSSVDIVTTVTEKIEHNA